jgi:hypothetical protein
MILPAVFGVSMTASRLSSCLTQSFPQAQKSRHIPPKELLPARSETSLWPTPLTEPQNCRRLEDDTEQPFADRNSWEEGGRLERPHAPS